MSGNLNQETNKLKDEVNKRELHFLRTGDPRPEPQVDKVAQAQASGPLCVENVTHACLPRLLVCLSLGLNCHSLSV